MRLVYSFRIDKNDSVYSDLERMSRVSKDLYNQALFEVKTHYAKTGKILSYPELDKSMKTLENLEGNINYRLLPAQVAQQTLRLLSQNVNAFFLANRDYQKHPDKYQGRPQFPQFLKKDAHFVVVFTNQKAAIKANGSIQLTQDIAVSIPEKEFQKYSSDFIKTDGKRVIPLFQQVRIVPKFNGDFFHVEIVYQKEAQNPVLDPNRTASIDFGVNNLIALVDSAMGEEERSPLLISGKPIKSINQFYNKKRASIQSELSRTNQRESKELRKLTDWRNQKINDYMHKASRLVINYCHTNRIGHLVIGQNEGWKQEINIGKRNNQNFVGIPFDRLIQQLQYKAQLVGIRVTLCEESYTSKCSALDLEEIGKHEDHAYAGHRVHRGLFQTAKGIFINADVNGALNILRKVVGDAYLLPIIEKVAQIILSSGVLWHPVKVCL